MKELDCCTICPRVCGTNRNAGELGYCHAGNGYAIGSVGMHYGEEPVISGKNGICNVFFSRCNMQCIYCQNFQISRRFSPVAETLVTAAIITESIIRCLDEGARAVGFVSPTHVVPQMLSIIENLNHRGYYPVIVYNSNGYDSVETLKKLEGIIDIYLPDFKYFDPVISSKYSDTPDYPDIAVMAIAEMYRQKGSTLIIDGEQATNGMIIRHLVLPGFVDNSISILKWIAHEISPAVHISVMSQYCPTICVSAHSHLGRKISDDEYEKVLLAMEELGLYKGWIQDLNSPEVYMPDFTNEHPFHREGN